MPVFFLKNWKKSGSDSFLWSKRLKASFFKLNGKNLEVFSSNLKIPFLPTFKDFEKQKINKKPFKVKLKLQNFPKILLTSSLNLKALKW